MGAASAHQAKARLPSRGWGECDVDEGHAIFAKRARTAVHRLGHNDSWSEGSASRWTSSTTGAAGPAPDQPPPEQRPRSQPAGSLVEGLEYAQVRLRLRGAKRARQLSEALTRRNSGPAVVGEEVVGRSIEVYWPLDASWYAAQVICSKSNGRHQLLYSDGTRETVQLAKERWRWLQEAAAAPPGEGTAMSRRDSVESASNDADEATAGAASPPLPRTSPPPSEPQRSPSPPPATPPPVEPPATPSPLRSNLPPPSPLGQGAAAALGASLLGQPGVALEAAVQEEEAGVRAAGLKRPASPLQRPRPKRSSGDLSPTTTTNQPCDGALSVPPPPIAEPVTTPPPPPLAPTAVPPPGDGEDSSSEDDLPLSRRSSAVWGGAGTASSREAAPPPALPGEVSGDESSESEVEAEVERPTLFDLADLAAAAVPAASEGGAPPQLTLPPPPPPHAAMLSSAAAVSVGVHVAVPVRGTHSARVLAGLQGGGGEALVRRKKKMRCGECEACVAPNCGECRFCLDMPKFGGVGTLRQPCLQRRCTKAHPASVAAASSSAPRSVTVLPSVPPALLGAPPVVARPVRAAGESSSPPATNEAAFLLDATGGREISRGDPRLAPRRRHRSSSTCWWCRTRRCATISRSASSR